MLRATTAYTFSTSQVPKVVRWCVLYILTWKCASGSNGVHFFDMSTSKSGPDLLCFVQFLYFLTSKRASRHNGVQFLISHLASFSEPQIIGKTQCFATFSTFSRICIFFLLLSSLFYSPLLSASAQLCFFHLSILSKV